MDASIKQVVSMLVSSDKITLFTITGEIIEIKNNEDYDTAKISEFLTPKLSGLGAVEINLTQFAIVAQILPSDLEDHGIVVTQVINGVEVQGIFYPRKVAVEVTVGKDKIAIPDVENLTGHIKRAVDEKSPSVANFLKRLAPVIQSRKHSGEDLMKFIKESEMPLTNDGRIIAYKRVNQHSDQGFFKDCHTGNVRQRVGSRVTMEVNLVDSSRHNSCSTGLHVANLGYMKSFNGSHTLIVLVNPEDFIAVPHNENTKARVCAYDIIGVISSKAHGTVNNGTHVSNDDQLKALVKAAVEGTYIRPFETIKVGNAGMIESVTPISGALQPTPAVSVVAKSSGKSLNEDKKETVAPKRNVMEVTRAAVQQNTAVTLPDDIAEAFAMLMAGIPKTQVADKFNTSTRSIGRWMEKHNYENWVKTAKLAAPTDPDEEEEETSPTWGDYQGEHPDEAEEVGQEALEITAEMAPQIIQNLTQKEAPVSEEDFAKLVQSSEAPKPLSKAQQIRKMFNAWVLGGFKEAELKAMKKFKAESKKSWIALGLTTKEEDSIKDAE